MAKKATGKPAQQPEKPDRPEEDILLQQLEVTLAGKQHTIKLLPIRPQAEWRKKVVPLLSGFLALSGISTENPAEFEAGLASILIETPEKMLDLFFDYARDLNRERIENTATWARVAVGFKKIVAWV